jgi:hypothetical protein
LIKKAHKLRLRLSKIQTTPTEKMNERDILTKGADVTEASALANNKF